MELRAYNESFPGGVITIATVHVVAQPVHYVALESAGPVAPYNSWTTAATNIQDAVDAATVVGALVLVSNGVYQAGAKAVYGVSNRVAVTKPVQVRSVNGTEVTTIAGYQLPGTTNGPAAIRCVYVTNGAVLAGFTLSKGATQTSGDNFTNQSGGGAWCEWPQAVLSNCVVTGNSAYSFGGGVSCGTLRNCTLASNSAYAGGGVYYGALSNCALSGNSAAKGGGVSSATLDDCALTGNWASNSGGGASGGTLNNCTLAGNWALGSGGGTSGGTLHGCTLTGNWAINGGGADSGTLNNCTLIGNSATNGGGASRGTLNNCTLTDNSASSDGGGAYLGVVNNCRLTFNWANNGGGASSATLNNCTLTGNWATNGSASCTLAGNCATNAGGAASCTLNNCIAYYNRARLSGDNYDDASSTLNYCCTTPLPSSGTGNLTQEPGLASDSHLSAASPCRGAGSAAYATGLDIDGEPWATPPSIGCDEYWSGAVTGAVSAAIVISYTNVAVGFETDLRALIGGRVSASRWDFGDGIVLSNRPYASHVWAAPGDYTVELRAYNESFPGGVITVATVHVVAQPVHYVALESAGPVAPYNSWTTAATNIQDAVDAATVVGALVLVSNGVYQAGAKAVYGVSNRVAVTKPVQVRSVNGVEVTTIDGAGQIRCVYLTNGGVLTGFTVTNGATSSEGGGVYCESATATVSNCMLTGNSGAYGGGVYLGNLKNCALLGNSASFGYGGAAYYAVLNNCRLAGNLGTFGGAAYYGTLKNCVLLGNSAEYGGGANGATLNNCTLINNLAYFSGGAAFYGTLNNCTVAGNSAVYFDGGGGNVTLNNCIVYYNTAGFGGENLGNATLNNCCTTPLPASGVGNITNPPGFIDTNGWSNLRLQSNSPCINAGLNAYATSSTDLDGRPRIVGSTVDIGAYEFQAGVSGAFIGWLQSFSLPTDGTADLVDTDHDGSNNWQEWGAGTNPTNGLSVLRLQAPRPVGPDLVLPWQSVPGRSYVLEHRSDLGAMSSFTVLATNLPAATGTNITTFTHTNASGAGPWFYRVKVN